ncbi:MAG: hypothetical protein R2932_49195 [Caldilineaceae bacterium]
MKNSRKRLRALRILAVRHGLDLSNDTNGTIYLAMRERGIAGTLQYRVGRCDDDNTRRGQDPGKRTAANQVGRCAGFAKLLTIIGAVLCITPLWPIGLCLAAVGLFFWPVTHAVEPLEVQAIAEAEASGGGCGWLVVAIVIIVFAGVLFMAVAGAVVGVGDGKTNTEVCSGGANSVALRAARAHQR